MHHPQAGSKLSDKATGKGHKSSNPEIQHLIPSYTLSLSTVTVATKDYTIAKGMSQIQNKFKHIQQQLPLDLYSSNFIVTLL